MASKIYFFSTTEAYYELSNFAPFGFVENGLKWPTVEHYFQAQKFAESAISHRELIRNAESPYLAKQLGQSRAIAIRNDWESNKNAIMKHALRLKFAEPTLSALLLSTYSQDLIENSPADRYWGIGREGNGKNWLGRLLMEIRSELRKAAQKNTEVSEF